MTLLLGWSRRHRLLTLRSELRPSLRFSKRTNTTRLSHNDWYKNRGKVSQEDNAVVRDASSTFANTPARIRTWDLRFRRPPLYPAELRGQDITCLFT